MAIQNRRIPVVTRTLAPALLPALLVAMACANPEPTSPTNPESTSLTNDTPAIAGVPAPGNGNKFVVPIDEDLPSVDCGGGTILAVHIEGWIQGREFPQPKNPNVALTIFHTVLTFTNSAGETFTFNDLGPDRVYFDDGNLVVAVVGRIGGIGLIGRLVIDLATGQVLFFAGKDIATVSDLACDALT
jgi:hypothetical protein